MRKLSMVLAMVIGAAASAPAFAQSASEAGFEADAGAWPVLRTAGFSEVDGAAGWHVAKTFPEELAALDGRTVRLFGYVMPLGPDGLGRHLMLTLGANDDPFHGDPLRVIEVTLEEAAPLSAGDRMLLEGRLELNRAPDTMQLFSLGNARPVTADAGV